MQPPCPRLLCRAHNRFTPSIVLWQHFVFPTQIHLRQQRLSSSATKAHPNDSTQNDTNLVRKMPASRRDSEAMTWKIGKKEHTTQPPSTRKHREQQTTGSAPAKRHGNRYKWLNTDGDLLEETKVAIRQNQNYKGLVVKAKVNPHPVKESELPWSLKLEESTMIGIDRLAIEIERFCEFAKPSRPENFARKYLIEQVRTGIRIALPEHALELFGSERNGIALATSDIDLRLMPLSHLSNSLASKMPPDSNERIQGMKNLRKLHRYFLLESRTYLLPMVRHARYPLISLQDRKSGLDVQIVLSNDTSMQRVIMLDYMEQYPYLRSLYYVVKTMFDIRGLSDVFRGGLGSYSIFMMVVASIRHSPHHRVDSAGGLMHFLKFWGTFDTTKHGVSVEPSRLYDKASQPVRTDTVEQKIKEGKSKPLPAYMLSLRDPADETNDLGRKTIAIKHIQATLRSLFQQLLADVRANLRPSLLGPLVGPSYMLDFTRRANLREYGELLLSQTHANSEMDEGLKRQTTAEDEQDQITRQERDKAWQKMAEAEHGEALTGILGMPSVSEKEDTNDSSTAEQSQSVASAPAEAMESYGAP